MGNTKKQSMRNKAFTIVELLTVMSIIIVLMALLVPGLTKARRYAKFVKQNAQFHSIDIALDQYSAENEAEGYPESTSLGAAPNITTGAHRLAEALIGRDLQGFDPQSTWDAMNDETNIATNYIYGKGLLADVEKSLERRRGPYLKIENPSSFQVCQLYTATGNVYPGLDDLRNASPFVAPVLTDVYEAKTTQMINGNGETLNFKAGSPILYYKANTASKTFDWTDDAAIQTSIFNEIDNRELVTLGTVKNPAVLHHFDPGYIDPATGLTGTQIFYKAITNPQIPATVSAPNGYPYNKESYILISAGFDGIFGTSDDVKNFGSK